MDDSMFAQRPAPGSDALSVDALRSRCSLLERDLVARGAKRAEFERHAPGGAENEGQDAIAWLHYFAQLQRRHAVFTERSSGVSAVAADVDEVLGAAASAQPELVPFDDGTVRAVHPKGLHALRWLDSLNRQLVRANALADEALAQAERLEALGEVAIEERTVTALAPLVESLAVRLWLWILTHPGAELPFADDAVDLEPPEWTKQATPRDIVRVFTAHLSIHQERLSIINHFFPSEPGGGHSKLSLAGFVSALAHEQGRDLKELQRRTSLGEVFVGALTAAQQAREARARADAESKKRHPGRED